MTAHQDWVEGDEAPWLAVNENNDALGQPWTFAQRPAGHTGLSVGIGGGPYTEAITISDQTVACADNDDTYIVANRATGVLSASTGTTNWNDSSTYGRVAIVAFAGGLLTSYRDFRFGEGGIFRGENASAGTELRGLTFTAETGSTADSDPGAGLFKWNHATQASATVLYIDEATADAVNVDASMGELDAGTLLIQQANDAARWQRWAYAATPVDGTGYWKLTVTLLEKTSGDIQDGALCYFDFDDEGAPGSSGMSTDPLWGAAGDLAYGAGNDAGNRLAIGTARQKLRVNAAATAPEWASDVTCIPIACSDETTALTTGTAKVTFRMPFAMTLTDVRASVTTAPTGGTLLTVDVNENGSSILSTKLTFDASAKTTTTAATPRVISDSSLADDAEITIDIDAVGSTVAGAGLKVYLIGYVT